MGADAMPKADDDIKKLQRSLRRLEHLGSALLRLSSGPHLVAALAILDPEPLMAAWQAGRLPTLAELKRSARLSREPWLVDAGTLRRLEQDLDVLRTPAAQAAIQESPRLFRRRDVLGRSFESLEQELEALRILLASPLPAPPEGAPAWTAELLFSISQIYGQGEGEALRDLFARSLRAGDDRRAATRRLDNLLRRLRSGAQHKSHDREVEAIAKRIELRFRTTILELGTLQGFLVHLLLGPGLPYERISGRKAFERRDEVVAEIGQALIAGAPERVANDPEKLANLLGHCALIFRIEPETPALRPRELGWLGEKLGTVLKAFAAQNARVELGRMRQLLIRFPPSGTLPLLAHHLAAGLSAEELEALLFSWPRMSVDALDVGLPALRTFANWLIKLAPSCLRLGIHLDLQPSIFEHLGGEERGDLLVLASSLLGLTQNKADGRIRQNLEMIESVADLCQYRPALAREIFGELADVAPGLGRQSFPQFADWLGDDALLDKLLHHQRLAGEACGISHTLLADFELTSRHHKELLYLESRAAELLPRQAERLAHLRQEGAPQVEPSRTRRRMAERIAALEIRILHTRLDETLDTVLQMALGLDAADLPPSWREAARFLLGSDANQRWLGEILRQAAGKRRPKSAWPLNAEWIEKARLHFDVEAWLAPRQRTLEHEGRKLVFAFEEEPLEVLKMGMAFNTCLSLDQGYNAASVVLNAIDANKQVLYIRDERGVIVGRKLLVVSSDWKLLRYHFYCSLTPPLRDLAKEAAQDFCSELLRDTGLEKASSGLPAEIHPGFWYDDRPQESGERQSRRPGDLEIVKAFCDAFALEAPPEIPAPLFTEALAWQAREDGNFEEALELLDEHLVEDDLHLSWLLEMGAATTLWQKAGNLPSLLPPLIEVASRWSSPASSLRAAARAWPAPDWRTGKLSLRILRLERSTELARAVAQAALQNEAWSRPDEGWVQLSLEVLPRLLADLPLPLHFEIVPLLEPVWLRYLSELDPSDERWELPRHLCLAAERAFRHDAASFPSLLEALRGKKGELARKIALAIAARFPLSRGTNAPSAGDQVKHGEVKHGDSTAMLAALGDLRAIPEIAASPELLAALLRQTPAGRVRELRLELPQPSSSPFAALGDLLYKEALAPLLEKVLAPFLPFPAAPEPVSPSGLPEETSHRGDDWEAKLGRADDAERQEILGRRLALAGEDEEVPFLPWNESFFEEILPRLLPGLGFKRAYAGLAAQGNYRRLLLFLGEAQKALEGGKLDPEALRLFLAAPPTESVFARTGNFWLSLLLAQISIHSEIAAVGC